jgi:hypothetical protein
MANLIDIQKQLGTEEQCLAYLEVARWGSTVACLKCGSVKVSKTVSTVKARKTGKVVKVRHLYDCLEPECQHQFSATTGTIFHDSHLPLSMWFMAVALICNAKKSLSALQLQRDLGVGSYRTAWYLNHRIREAMKETPSGQMTGTVEVDDTRIAGKYDKRRRRQRWETQVAVGLVERSKDAKPSQVRTFKAEKAGSAELIGAVLQHVIPEATLYTDEAMVYRSLDSDFRRESVNHIEKEWARGEVSTNSIEGFWSLFKRGIHGSWHHISPKHLQRYLDEFAYRFNNRGAADLFGQTVIRMANTEPLPYKDLISG